MASVEQLDRNGDAAILGMAATVATLWRRCCAHDSIDPNSLCVAFSEGNPYAPYYDKALGMLREMQAARRAVGYVGLTMENGRAGLMKKNPRRPSSSGGSRR